ncbi:hypothetical protein [Pedobacter miscanthi]|uniref:Uncharacterized protein n=1 Tax=Pedobacter miscanthi TaxID=2259170 RepID=A0A366KN79_9SPHI|nr:hypothetical protein [Pedobacter miscanthi]RBQ03126.1 hypothetical protein DRW42_23110 [Pedobacter miscanthi]
MIKQIKRKKCLAKYPIFPLRTYSEDIEDYDYFYPNTFSNYILTLKSKSYKKHLKNLGEELSNLCACLKSNHFIFLGDEKLAWRFREGKYKNFKKGMDYFASEGIKKKFSGGLLVGENDMLDFTKHLAYLTAVNGLIQYIHFTDESQNIIGSICNYGDIHVSTINEISNELFINAVSDTKFDFLDGKCNSQFDIKGKRSTSF